MKIYTRTLAVLFLTFLALAVQLFAEDNKNFSDTEIATLINGIKSKNDGLMRSSIYFAGKYEIGDAADALIEKLKEETDPSNIVLIALSLYKIGDQEAIYKVLELANSSDNERVKRILSAIVLEHLKETNSSYVLR